MKHLIELNSILIQVVYSGECSITANGMQISEVMIVEVEGIKLEIANRPPINGEMYVAERNIGKQLLTAKFADEVNRWVIPFEKAYVYNLCECKAVIRMVE